MIPVIGTNKLDRIDSAAKAADIKLERQDWYALWEAAQAQCGFDPARSVFVDDNHAVLESARDYGLRWLVTIDQPDSMGEVRTDLPWPAVRALDELL